LGADSLAPTDHLLPRESIGAEKWHALLGMTQPLLCRQYSKKLYLTELLKTVWNKGHSPLGQSPTLCCMHSLHSQAIEQIYSCLSLS
jgi:hypothetical protein